MASDARLAVANAAFAAGRWAEAAAAAGGAARAHPLDPGPALLLGRTLLRVGRPADAAAWFRRAVVLDPAAMAGWANLGGALRRAGATDAAGAAVRRALALEPERAELQFNLGNLLRGGGDPAASPAFRRALALRPDLAEAWVNLGLCAHDGGAAGDAVAVLRRALVVTPDHGEALANLAAVLAAAGRPVEALAASVPALRARPADTGLWRDRGAALLALGRVAEARAALMRGAALDPASFTTWWRLGQAVPASADPGNGDPVADAALRRAVLLEPAEAEAGMELAARLARQGRRRRAVAAATRTVVYAPGESRRTLAVADALMRADRPEDAGLWARRALCLGGNDRRAVAMRIEALRNGGRTVEAGELARRACAAWPDDAPGLYNAAVVPVESRDWPEVERLAGRAIRMDPAFGPAHYTLGLALKGQRRIDEALAAYEAGLRLSPDLPRERFNRAMALMAAGDVRRGLEECEWRWQTPGHSAGRRLWPRPTFPMPLWTGGDLAGRSILVWGEQGVGDEIWDAGCLPAVIARAGHCVIECEHRLAPLFRRSFPDALVVERTIPPDPRVLSADLQCPMGSLLLRLGPDPARPPAPGYLSPDAALLDRLRRRYRRSGGPVVGLAWRSRKAFAHRSFAAPLQDWEPLLRLPGVAFVSLQYGDVTEDVAAARRRSGVGVYVDSQVDALQDLDSFAAQVAACDLVVSIANATIPMAHAVGRPAIAVLRRDQDDWRYAYGCERPPWLPLVHTVQQTMAGNWAETLHRAADTASKWLSRPSDKASASTRNAATDDDNV